MSISAIILPVLVQVRRGIGHRRREIVAEARGVVLLSTARRGNDDPIGARQSREERRARRRTVDHRQWSFARREPRGEFFIRDVRAAQVELRLAAVEGAVTDQDDPEGLPRAVGLGLDVSKAALRRAARVHPRAAAAFADL